jgi:hypothetical protein
VLDGLSAVAITLLCGGKVIRTFQGIAAGILGPAAFQRGINTAMLGVALHFPIAYGAAATDYLASRYTPFLIDRALAAGILNGIAVHLFMQFVGVLIAHIVVVEPSIALTVARYSR